MKINNEAINKIAPNLNHLTDEQKQLIDRIETLTKTRLHDGHSIFTIYGDCGTGKSVVLSQLFFDIQKAAHDPKNPLYETKNYFLVNHPEVLKVYKQIVGTEDNVLKKNFMRPTSFIKSTPKKQTSSSLTKPTYCYLSQITTIIFMVKTSLKKLLS